VMLHAVEAPFLKVAAVAGVAAIGGMLALAPAAKVRAHDCGEVRRLVLHAPEAENAIYLTAWDRGDIFVRVPAGEPREIVFQTRARVWDGCEWLATERLVPHAEGVYLYSYDEQVLSCDPGATPTGKTPRTGFVVSIPR
jgi:hypothetical protein